MGEQKKISQHDDVTVNKCYVFPVVPIHNITGSTNALYLFLQQVSLLTLTENMR